MRRIVLILLLLASAASLASGNIYRWTDADGHVVYGDNPPEGVDAEAIRLREPMTTPAMPDAREILERGRTDETGEPALPYARLQITSPEDDEPIRANDGNFSVHVGIDPELRTDRGHRLRLIMDGAPAGITDLNRFDLVNVDRGTHRISVQVLDRNDQVIQESGELVFHLLRHHIN